MAQTLGCVMLENPQMAALFERVDNGTPVTIVGALLEHNSVERALVNLSTRRNKWAGGCNASLSVCSCAIGQCCYCWRAVALDLDGCLPRTSSRVEPGNASRLQALIGPLKQLIS